MATTNSRSLSEQERINVTGILRQTPVGFLAVAAEGPYVVPINFAYEASESSEGWGRLLFHSGRGAKSRAIARDARVCIALVADAMFDRGVAPCDDGFAYRSVLVEGRAVLLRERAEREEALRMIVAKYDPVSAGKPLDEEVLRRTLVYSVKMEAVSFKERRRRD